MRKNPFGKFHHTKNKEPCNTRVAVTLTEI